MKTNVTYHPDHLGSNSFVTNVSGIAIQELRYMPYGEILTKSVLQAATTTPHTNSLQKKKMLKQDLITSEHAIMWIICMFG